MQRSKSTGRQAELVLNQEKVLSRGLLRDYEPSDAIRMQLFEALNTSVRSEGISLPDMDTAGVSLSQGRLSGMANWARWGDAKLDTK